MSQYSIFNQTDKILDEARLEKLYSLGLLDTESEASFDRITQLASDALCVPISLITLIDANRAFFKSQVGLDEPTATERMLPLSHSFCKYLVQTEDILLVEDATQDERVRDNLAISEFDIMAYAGIPIKLSDGHIIGAFCVMDTQPHSWSEREIRILENLSTLVITEIELHAGRLKQQQAEDALNASEMKFQQIAQSANDAIIVLNDNAEIIFCNKATSRVFGYTEEELIHKSLDDFTQDNSQAAFQQLSFGLFSPTSKNEEWQAIRLMGRHKDGSDIPIEVSLSTFTYQEEQFFTLIIRDIQAQVMIESELRASEARYLQVLDAIPDFVFVKDPNMNLIWANKALQEYRDMPIEEMTIKSEAEYVDNDLLQEYNNVDALVFKEGKTQIVAEEAIVRHDGTVRQFTTAKTPIFDETGQVALLVGISRDITDSKNLEHYLTDALEKNQELVELKSSFTSMVSHEFRTPLSVILSSTEILINYFDRLTEKRRHEKLATIRDQVKRLTHLMDAVLVVSEGDSKGLPFKPSLHNIHTLSYNIIEEVKIAYSTSDVTIEYAYQGNCEHQYIDENLFRHILQNLLSNAIKYSRPNSEVQTRINCSENQLTMVVVDQGIGIPKENQEHLYQTFHRANNVGTISGTGLGLAIVKRAVDTHGGTINFKSVENEGTMFVVTLPTNELSTGE